MNILKGDIFNYHNQNGVYIGCTTNGILNKKGQLVMGKGIALQFKNKFKDIDSTAGLKVKRLGNRVFRFDEEKVFTFPTKNHYSEKADLWLIEESTKQLVELAKSTWPCVYLLPYPGIGCGELTKEQVEPVLKKHLKEIENIYVIEYERI